MIAKITDLEVGYFVHTLGDAHLYKNHLKQAKTQIKRKTKNLPSLKIKRKPGKIEDFIFEDFDIVDYQFHPHIPAPIAV